jgi:hypothetical protein
MLIMMALESFHPGSVLRPSFSTMPNILVEDKKHDGSRVYFDDWSMMFWLLGLDGILYIPRSSDIHTTMVCKLGHDVPVDTHDVLMYKP